MKIQLDKTRHEMPVGGRPRHKLAHELLALRTGGSLTVTCRTKDESNRLRQVCARLKASNPQFDYCSRWLQGEKLLRIWRTNEIY